MLQSTIVASMMMETYKEVVYCVSEKVQRAAISQPAAFNVKDMPSEGLAQGHNVGAWAIRKVVNDHRKYEVCEIKHGDRKQTNS